ncbi:hypothetical protein DFH06DRAFT_1124558 [Mycena polygramma]|nr:hypothetical protein DFH06DRAFT_1124558 [Mycena polygramma]
MADDRRLEAQTHITHHRQHWSETPSVWTPVFALSNFVWKGDLTARDESDPKRMQGNTSRRSHRSYHPAEIPLLQASRWASAFKFPASRSERSGRPMVDRECCPAPLPLVVDDVGIKGTIPGASQRLLQVLTAGQTHTPRGLARRCMDWAQTWTGAVARDGPMSRSSVGKDGSLLSRGVDGVVVREKSQVAAASVGHCAILQKTVSLPSTARSAATSAPGWDISSSRLTGPRLSRVQVEWGTAPRGPRPLLDLQNGDAAVEETLRTLRAASGRFHDHSLRSSPAAMLCSGTLKDAAETVRRGTGDGSRFCSTFLRPNPRKHDNKARGGQIGTKRTCPFPMNAAPTPIPHNPPPAMAYVSLAPILLRVFTWYTIMTMVTCAGVKKRLQKQNAPTAVSDASERARFHGVDEDDHGGAGGLPPWMNGHGFPAEEEVGEARTHGSRAKMFSAPEVLLVSRKLHWIGSLPETGFDWQTNSRIFFETTEVVSEVFGIRNRQMPTHRNEQGKGHENPTNRVTKQGPGLGVDRCRMLKRNSRFATVQPKLNQDVERSEFRTRLPMVELRLNQNVEHSEIRTAMGQGKCVLRPGIHTQGYMQRIQRQIKARLVKSPRVAARRRQGCETLRGMELRKSKRGAAKCNYIKPISHVLKTELQEFGEASWRWIRLAALHLAQPPERRTGPEGCL